MDFQQWAVKKVQELTTFIESPGVHPANVMSAVDERRGVRNAFYAYRDIAAGRDPKPDFSLSPERRWNDEVVNTKS